MNKIFFYKPSKTLPISLTGNHCEMNCSHCGGHYLEQMTDAHEFVEHFKDYKSYSSVLVSGGCSPFGEIVLSKHKDKLQRIGREGFKLNFHTGLASEDTVQTIEELARLSPRGKEFRISFDFVVDDETIREVYHLDKTGKDYIESYAQLKQKFHCIPHICIGLLGGKVKGEIKALEELAKIGASKVVFIILVPTKGTAFSQCAPPELSQIGDVFRKAKELFKNIPIQLGCMRPIGKLRNAIDLLAMDCGINHIVQPSKETVATAQKRGLEIEYKEECCVL